MDRHNEKHTHIAAQNYWWNAARVICTVDFKYMHASMYLWTVL